MRRKQAFTLVEPFGVAHGKLPAVRPFGKLRPGKRERPAFTLIELLVVIVILALLVTILVPPLLPPCGESERTVCQSNLKVIGKAYQDYAHLNPNAPFPRHIDDGDAHDTTAATGLKTADTLDAAIGTCGMQTVWVMIDKGYLSTSAFKCPGDADWTSRDTTDKYGWGALTEFSYGIHYPYASDGAGTANPADPNARDAGSDRRLTYNSYEVLFADRNPGGAVDGTAIEHSNHGGEDGGCMVVSRVGNVWSLRSATDSKAWSGDDIYTDEGDTASPVPDSADDTVITPQISR